MFNTTTLTKYGGALAGALLVFLLINWASDSIYGLTKHEGEAKPAYVIETAEAPQPAEKAAATAPSEADILAAGDAAKGKKVFSKCKACHKIEPGVNATGPSLYGVVGRDVASEPKFSYSGALKGVGGKWTVARLSTWLKKPRDFAPGTKMGFAGLKKLKDRANVIAYLGTLAPAGAQKAAAPAAAPAKAAAPAPAKAAPAAPAPAPAPKVAAAGDPAKGKKVFKKCKVCHKTVAGVNGIGPSLFGVVGRPVASEAGYSYSNALKGLGGNWTEARLSDWLKKPRDFAPGTKMGFGGLKKEKDRVNIIAYLKSLSN